MQDDLIFDDQIADGLLLIYAQSIIESYERTLWLLSEEGESGDSGESQSCRESIS
jgi:hypothetical protein